MHFPQQLERGGCEVLTQRGRWWKGNRLHVDRRWLSSPAGYTEDSFRGREEPQPLDQMRGFQEVSEATWVQSQARGRGWPGCEGIIIGACLTEERHSSSLSHRARNKRKQAIEGRCGVKGVLDLLGC